MTYTELKALKAEDFLAPNPVLCYGGGGAFQGVAPYMADCGINIVGVIDANKTGSVGIKGKEIPLLTMEKAIALYGTDIIVIITIANRPAFQQVKQDLIEHGYAEEKIFDLNVWTWLTVPSEKSYCKDLVGYMNFLPDALAKCCHAGAMERFLCEWFMGGRPLQESIESFFEKRSYYIEESKQGRIPLYCRNCSFLTREQAEGSAAIAKFNISDNTYCNADCVYCCHACSIPHTRNVTTVEERFDAILYTLEKLQQEDMLDRHCVITVASGEIPINPYKEKIYETLKRVLVRSPNLRLEIFSNCFIFDQGLADLLALGKGSFLQCDLDAGTPESYIEVKGFNKFDTVRENLKKYTQFGTVKLRYIILPGWNDSPADYDGTVRLLKELGADEMMLSLEFSVSRSGDRMRVRKALYAAARLMALLEQNEIKVTLRPEQWRKENILILQRLCREIRSLSEV